MGAYHAKSRRHVQAVCAWDPVKYSFFFPAGNKGWWIVTPFQMAICFGTTVANMIVAGQAMKVRLISWPQLLSV
jgi:hypothetical protein